MKIPASRQKRFKDGWYSSPVVKASYLKKGFIPDTINLLSNPDPRYDNGVGILSDGDLGDQNYRYGQWLAWQTIDAGVELAYKKPVKIQKIQINMLENTGAQIFPPVKIEIWDNPVSGKSRLLGSLQPAMPDSNQTPHLSLRDINFPLTEVQRLKIVVRHLEHLPAWHKAKGNPAWVLISEIMVN